VAPAVLGVPKEPGVSMPRYLAADAGWQTGFVNEQPTRRYDRFVGGRTTAVRKRGRYSDGPVDGVEGIVAGWSSSKS